MNVYNFTEYKNIRNEYLKDEDTSDFYFGRRGAYRLYPPHIIRWNTEECTPPSIQKIVNSEVELMWSGETVDPIMERRLYKDDDDLLKAYRELQLIRLSKVSRPKSRNNVIINKICCLPYWQLIDKTLYTVSRSMDLQRAGLTDLYVITEIARRLNLKHCICVSLNPHVYVDKTNIARRTDGQI